MTDNRPAWLRERVNDAFGTYNTHPFWDTQPVKRVGVHKIFERDGVFYRYDSRWNAWYRHATMTDAVDAAERHPDGLDIWA